MGALFVIIISDQSKERDKERERKSERERDTERKREQLRGETDTESREKDPPARLHE
jgi:hypothetical protein